MNKRTIYSDTITNEGLLGDTERGRSAMFSTSTSSDAPNIPTFGYSNKYVGNGSISTEHNSSLEASRNFKNLKNRSRNEYPRHVRQGFSGQYGPEFDRLYLKPVDLEKTLGKGFREAQFYSLGWSYMSGGQWFNPFSLHPHPLLEQKTSFGGSTFGTPLVGSFDTYLKIYGMMSDSIKNVTKFHMANGGHMGIKLDVIGGRKTQNRYFDQNLNQVRENGLHKGMNTIETITSDGHYGSSDGTNTIWSIGQNDLGNRDKRINIDRGNKRINIDRGNERINIDRGNKENPTVKKTLADRRSKLRVIYCAVVNLFLFMNILRMIACHFMVHERPLLEDTVDGGKREFDPLEGYIRGQGLKPPKGFGGFGVSDGPPDLYTRFMWGDLSPFWTRRPHLVTVPVIIISSFALIINLFLEYFQNDRQKRWLLPFSVLSGQITPAEARIRSKYQLEKMEYNVRHSFRIALFLTIFWTVVWSGFYFWSALNFTQVPTEMVQDVKNGLIYARTKSRISLIQRFASQTNAGQYSSGTSLDGNSLASGGNSLASDGNSLASDGNSLASDGSGHGLTVVETSPKMTILGSYKVTLFWTIINSVNAFYVTGIIIWSLTYFHCLTWYIRIRFKRLNKICYALLDLSNGIIPLSKRNEFMSEVLHEHNLTSADVTSYNRFWKWFLLVSFFFLVPIIFWLVYILFFYWQGTLIIKSIALIVACQFGFFMGLMVASGETVSNQAHMLWRWLNTLCLYEWPIVIKFRMAYLIERLGGPTLGFTCYDFFVVARETFYEMALLLGTYFFLTYEFVLSSL